MNNTQTTDRPKIVVIDDDREILKLIMMLLRRMDAEAVTFHDPDAALHHFADHTADLIIVDLMMPIVNGFELIQRIRQQNRLDAIPILILSAKTDPQSIRQALEYGADGFVTKPYIANSLVDRVRTLLSEGRSNSAPPAGK